MDARGQVVMDSSLRPAAAGLVQNDNDRAGVPHYSMSFRAQRGIHDTAAARMLDALSSWILHFVPLPRDSFRMTMMRLCPLRLTMTHPRYCHPESAASGRRIHDTEAAWMHEARSSWILHFVPLPRDSFRMTMMRLCPLRLTSIPSPKCHPERSECQ